MADRRTEVSVKITTEMLRGSPVGESLERIASLLIRQDIAMTDEGIGPQPADDGDAGVLDWAVATAGHLFEDYILEYCGLLPQESPSGVVEGTVDGIRPHRPMTPEQDARARRYAELWEQGNVILPGVVPGSEGGRSDGA